MILLVFLLRILLALIFIRAGVLKLLSRPAFREAVANYDLVPGRLLTATSWSVPIAEFLGGSLLLVGVEPRATGACLGVLLIVFCVAITANLLRGRIISCGCSGAVASDISWGHVAINFAWAVTAAIVVLWPAEPLTLLPGVHDIYQSAAWASRATAMTLILIMLGAVALLATEASRVLAIISPATKLGKET